MCSYVLLHYQRLCRRQMDVYGMEERLGVEESSRFPLYRQLMWRAAHHFSALVTIPAGMSLVPRQPGA